jgi:hypothetical protein
MHWVCQVFSPFKRESLDVKICMNGNFLLLFSFVEISGIAQSSRKINQIQGLGLLRPKTGAKWVCLG